MWRLPETSKCSCWKRAAKGPCLCHYVIRLVYDGKRFPPQGLLAVRKIAFTGKVDPSRLMDWLLTVQARIPRRLEQNNHFILVSSRRLYSVRFYLTMLLLVIPPILQEPRLAGSRVEEPSMKEPSRLPWSSNVKFSAWPIQL